jgi:hypothetical protein
MPPMKGTPPLISSLNAQMRDAVVVDSIGIHTIRTTYLVGIIGRHTEGKVFLF